MIEKITNDLKLKLDIKNENIKYYTDGKSDSIVFSLNNKYLIKTVDENTLNTQVEFLRFYKDSNFFQKIITYNKELKYICFEFLEGENFSNIDKIDVKDIVNQIYNITSSYKKYSYDGYRYLYENRLSWDKFLESEVEYSKKEIESININLKKVYEALKNIKNYHIDKYLIHGDFGTHNFLVNDNNILVIDPMPIVGDRIYDFYFALFSNVSLFNNLDISCILKFFDEDINYKKSLLMM